MYKKDLILNNQRELICHKTQQNKFIRLLLFLNSIEKYHENFLAITIYIIFNTNIIFLLFNSTKTSGSIE